jgi:hypothetical protein
VDQQRALDARGVDRVALVEAGADGGLRRRGERGRAVGRAGDVVEALVLERVDVGRRC